MSPTPTKRRRAKPAPPRAVRLADKQLLRSAIDLTVDPATRERVLDGRFATDVLMIHPRTLRKKLEGRRLTALERRTCEMVLATEGQSAYETLQDSDRRRGAA